MKEIVKIYYVLDKEDKKSIQKQMIDLNLNCRKLAQQLGISLAYVNYLLNGNRNLTKELKDKLEIIGIQLKGENNERYSFKPRRQCESACYQFGRRFRTATKRISVP